MTPEGERVPKYTRLDDLVQATEAEESRVALSCTSVCVDADGRTSPSWNREERSNSHFQPFSANESLTQDAVWGGRDKMLATVYRCQCNGRKKGDTSSLDHLRSSKVISQVRRLPWSRVRDPRANGEEAGEL
jgi:hypothetical protein